MTRVVAYTGVWLLAAAVMFVLWGVVNDHLARHRRRSHDAIVRLLTDVLLGDDALADQATRQLMRERRALVTRALQGLAVDLRGDVLARTRHLVEVLGIRSEIASMARSRRRLQRVRAAELISLVTDDATAGELLRDDDALVRALTVESAGAANLARRRGVLHELLCDPAQVVRATVQDALIRSSAGLEEIRSSLADERTIDAALAVVSRVPDPNVIELALAHIESESPSRRAAVAQALGHSVDPEVSSHLLRLLDDVDAAVREAAARAAGASGRGELAAALGHALGDPSWTVRHAAGEALSRLGPLGSMVLYGHLDDDDAYARDMALRFVHLLEEGGGTWGRTVHVGFARARTA